jgi:hypothetical protein
MIIWGGGALVSSGGPSSVPALVYTPSKSTWKLTSPAPVGNRTAHAAVWSPATSTMLVWGGYSEDRGYGVVDLGPNTPTGLEYNPATDTWSTLPEGPLATWPVSGNAVWTGKEMLVWGGPPLVATPSPLILQPSGARYDPVARTWTVMSDLPAQPDLGTGQLDAFAWSGTELYTWGGGTWDEWSTGSGIRSSGGAVYGAGGGWSALPRLPADAFNGVHWPLERQASWFGGGRFYVWSGMDITQTGVASGEAFDPSTATWTTMPQMKAPAARLDASVVTTDTAAIVWGGASALAAQDALKNGGIYTW